MISAGDPRLTRGEVLTSLTSGLVGSTGPRPFVSGSACLCTTFLAARLLSAFPILSPVPSHLDCRWRLPITDIGRCESGVVFNLLLFQVKLPLLQCSERHVSTAV